MDKLKDFLKLIHVPEATIEKLTGEGEVKIEDIATAYLTSRNQYYESSFLKDKLENERNATAKGMTLKSIKKMNELLGMGLTNVEMEKFESMDTFLAKAKEYKEKYEETLKSENVKALTEQIDKWKLDATAKQAELDKLNGEWETFKSKTEAEKDDAIRTFKAKEYWQKMITTNESIADIPGKNFALEAIQERIFGKYKVLEDGTIKNLDGSVATHPEKEIAVTHLNEIFPYYQEKAGLLKKSNAGSGTGGTDGKTFVVDKGSGKVAGSDGFGANAMKIMEQLNKAPGV